ncbi:hypothetical protein ACLOJK_006662 [Asimina triloba]
MGGPDQLIGASTTVISLATKKTMEDDEIWIISSSPSFWVAWICKLDAAGGARRRQPWLPAINEDDGAP